MLKPIKLASKNYLSSLDTSCEEFLHILEIAKNFKNKNQNIKLKEKVKNIEANDKTKTIQELDREKLEKKFSKEHKEKLN